ncbi:hypothetical protein K9L67_01355 [Candidatus Woesearchaeota archaeon]|nr:hypothetical protein [Candidatus Woesearchaeota archaeon]MCF7900851.1 hypothetical protein [Candidatus Woesearchaeota archaeon]MCF8013827.1 hypothetical protein [Candidatus Woesearchaeota archaeon]
MKCAKCNKNGKRSHKQAGKIYCDKHYTEIIEKRIRKYLRINKKIDTKQEYNLKGPKEEKEILKKILENIFNKRLKITNKQTNNTISAQTADQEAEELINEFLQNTTQKETKDIKPFGHITEKELQILKKIYKITIKQRQTKKLDEIEEKYPGTKFSIIKTKEFLKNKK